MQVIKRSSGTFGGEAKDRITVREEAGWSYRDKINPQSYRCPEDNGLFPNLHNCQTYFQCENGTSSVKECSPGLHFNSATKVCDWPEKAHCLDGGHEQLTFKARRLGEYVPGVNCPSPRCNCIFPSQERCDQYFLCRSGKAYLFTCSPGLLFSQDMMSCDYEEFVSCGPETTTADFTTEGTTIEEEITTSREASTTEKETEQPTTPEATTAEEETTTSREVSTTEKETEQPTTPEATTAEEETTTSREASTTEKETEQPTTPEATTAEEEITTSREVSTTEKETEQPTTPEATTAEEETTTSREVSTTEKETEQPTTPEATTAEEETTTSREASTTEKETEQPTTPEATTAEEEITTSREVSTTEKETEQPTTPEATTAEEETTTSREASTTEKETEQPTTPEATTAEEETTTSREVSTTEKETEQPTTPEATTAEEETTTSPEVSTTEKETEQPTTPEATTAEEETTTSPEVSTTEKETEQPTTPEATTAEEETTTSREASTTEKETEQPTTPEATTAEEETTTSPEVSTTEKETEQPTTPEATTAEEETTTSREASTTEKETEQPTTPEATTAEEETTTSPEVSTTEKETEQPTTPEATTAEEETTTSREVSTTEKQTEQPTTPEATTAEEEITTSREVSTTEKETEQPTTPEATTAEEETTTSREASTTEKETEQPTTPEATTAEEETTTSPEVSTTEKETEQPTTPEATTAEEETTTSREASTTEKETEQPTTPEATTAEEEITTSREVSTTEKETEQPTTPEATTAEEETTTSREASTTEKETEQPTTPEATTAEEETTTSREASTTEKETEQPTTPEATTAEEETTISREVSTTEKQTEQSTTPEATTAEEETTTSREASTTEKETEQPTTPEATTAKEETTTSREASTTEKETEQPTTPEATTAEEETTTSREASTTEKVTEQPTTPEATTAEEETTTSREASTTEKETEQPTTPEATTAEEETTTSREASTTEKETEQPTTPEATTAEEETTNSREASTTEKETEQPTTPEATTAEEETTTSREASTTEKETEQPTTPEATTAEEETSTSREASTTEKETEQPTTPEATTAEEETTTSQATTAEEETTTSREASTTEKETEQPTTPEATTAEEETTTSREASTTAKQTEQSTTPEVTTAEEETTTSREASTTEKQTEQPTTIFSTNSEDDTTTKMKTTSSEIPTSTIRTSTNLPVTPTMDPNCPEPNGIFAGEDEDCSSFYLCFEGVAQRNTCPEGLDFNAFKKVCDWKWNVDCEGTSPVFPPPDEYHGLDCPCTGCVLVQPTDCRQYFYCDQESHAFLFNCSDGLAFSPDLGTCVRSSGCGESTSTVGPTTSEETIQPSTEEQTTQTSPEEQTTPTSTKEQTTQTANEEQTTTEHQKFECPQRNGWFPHPTICTVFYQCSNWIPHEIPCPSGLFFNPTSNVCDWPEEAGCGTPATGTTPQDHHASNFSCPCDCCMVADPNSCDSFYICRHFEAFREDCSEGLKFNTELLNCDLAENVDCGSTTRTSTTARPSTITSTTARPNTTSTTTRPSTDTSTTARPSNTTTARPNTTTTTARPSTKTSTTERPSTTARPSTKTSTTARPSTTTRPSTKTSTTARPSTTTRPSTKTSTTARPSTTARTSTITSTTARPNTTTTTTRPSTKTSTTTRPSTKTSTTARPNTTTTTTRPSTKTSTTSRPSTKTSTTERPNTTTARPNTTTTTTRPSTKTSTTARPSTKTSTTARPSTKTSTTARPNTTTARPSNTTTTTIFPTQNPHCPHPNGMFPIKDECESFYVCSGGISEKKSCPPGLFFNAFTKVCDWEWNAGCEGSSPVFPPPEDYPGMDCPCIGCVLVQPTNCRQYIYCDQESNALLFNCSNGLAFSPDLKTCVKSSGCGESTSTESPALICPEPNGLFPHPTHCSQFLHCSHGVPYVKDCPSDLHFNRASKVCDWQEQAGCIGGSTPAPPPTPEPSHGIDCPCDGCLIPDHEDCSSYFLCTSGMTFRFRCSPGLSFNPKLGTCDDRQNFHCHVVPCPHPEGLFPHPTDCHRFYQCHHSVPKLVTCPQDWHFNPDSKRCMEPCLAGCAHFPHGCAQASTPSEITSTGVETSSEQSTTPNLITTRKGPSTGPETSSSRPETEGTSTEPATATSSSRPETEGPSTEPETEGPSTEPETEGPSTEPETEGPSMEPETEGPSTEPETEGPSTETEGTSTEPETEGPSTEPETEGPSTEPETEGPSTEPETEGPSTEPETEGPSTEPETEGPSTEPETIGPSTEPETEGPSTELETEGPSTEPETEGPSTEQETEGPSTELETEGPSTEPETEGPSTEQETEGPSTEPETEGPSTELETEGPSTEPETEGPSTEQETEGPSTEPETEGPSMEPETEGPRTEPETEGPSTEPETEGPSTEPETEGPSTEQETEGPSTEPETEGPSTEPETEGPSTEPETEGPSTEPETEGPSTETEGPSTEPETEGPSTEPETSSSRGEITTTEATTERSTMQTAFSTSSREQSTKGEATTTTATTPEYHCPRNFGLFPHPTRCDKFVHCSHGIPYFKDCPDQLNFNTENNVCDWPENVDCHNREPVEPTVPPSHLECPCDGCLLSDKTDCASYFLCTNGASYHFRCGPGLSFNPKKSTCDHKSDFRCKQPICPESSGIFPDPEDCRSYVSCSEGIPHFHDCPPGLHFNPTAHLCQDPCLAECDHIPECLTPSPIPEQNQTTPVSSSSWSTAYTSSQAETTTKIPEQNQTTPEYTTSWSSESTSPQDETTTKIPEQNQTTSESTTSWSKETTYPPTETTTKIPEQNQTTPESSTSWSKETTYPPTETTTKIPEQNQTTPESTILWSTESTSPQTETTTKIPDQNQTTPESSTSWSTESTSPPTETTTKIPEQNQTTPESSTSWFSTTVSESPSDITTNDYVTFNVTNRSSSGHLEMSTTPVSDDHTDFPSFECPTDFGIFPIRDQCDRYIFCSHGVPYLKSCPNNLHFNPITYVCDWPDKVDCGSPSPTLPPAIPSPETCICQCCLMPDPSDCTQFVLCLNGTAYSDHCGVGLAFNPDLETCDHPAGNCTDPLCRDDPEGSVSNPLDCSTFYECSNGIPFLHVCEEGLHFSPASLTCQPPCQAGCDSSLVTRTRFTKVVNVLDSEISKTNADLGVIKDKFSKLKDIDFKLKDLDQKMLDHMMVADAEEDTLNCEIEEAEHYSDTFITLERKVRELIDSDNKSDVKSLGSSNGSLMAKSYKLPKIEIRKFDGELINWLPFWAQFEKIHEDTELHDADKFHYLVQSMQSNTRARELIESYPQTADNYAKAVQALKQRYGQKDLLVEIYVRELLKLMMANVKTPPDERRSVAKLYDKLETQLRSLESLGVDTKENTAWLFPMIESCLPEDVLVAWQRSPLNNCDASKNSNSNSSSRLNNLLDFLRREEMGCLFCENNHQSKDCITAQSMPFKDKRAKIYEKRCCLKCLKPGHLAMACKRTVQCNICAKGHYVLLCPDLPCNRKEKTHVSEVVQSALANQQCTRDVTLMTLMVNIMGNSGYRRVRALLDPGSQKSYILESTALEVKLKPVGNVNIAHSLFGGTQTETKCHKVYTVALCSNLSELDTLREFEFLGQDIICGEIPRTPKGAWLNELKVSRIWLSDLGRDSPKIELLIGSDIYGSLLSGRVKQLENGLTALETHLGWTICGPSPKKDEQTDYSSLVVISMHSRNMSVDYLWDLETIGIKDPRENLTKLEEDKIVHQHFLNTVHQLEDGRFCVGLPWLGNQEGIPSNRHIAERRLFNTTRKLRAKCIFSEYDRVFQEWLAEGVIEKVSPEDLNRKCHYLPHHPVVKANSNTTKIRPVFDASCKDKGNLSLNDCLASGPNVIEQIPAILLKFREKAIGVIADIRKAFLQIEVKEEDRDYLRFLWWKNNHQIQVFRHKRVVFGVTCSPYLLGAVILHHLKGVSSEFGALPQKLMECLYIDNCVTSVDTEAELVDLVEKSTEIFARAKMDLRMWQFGPIHRVKEVYSRLPPSVDIERSEEASVLGMKWDLLEDTLNVTPKFGVITNSLSKRDLLSHTQQIFDPIGFLAPVLLPAKLLIQQAWTVKTDWDEPLPSTIQENFMKWYSELDTLADIKIPRRVGHGIRAHWSIHIFCDASQSAYAAAAFLRCPENKGVSVQLLMAKSRLGPLKKTTIPRMELLACMLGVRLSRLYYSTFMDQDKQAVRHLWSLNPADLPSRGCSVLQLKRTRWWEGPEWLKQPQDHWPKQLFHSDRTLVNLEIDRQVLVTTHVRTEVMPWFERFSNFTKIVRINAWIWRFIRNTQKLSPSGMHSLQLSELEDAERGIWKTVQQQVFSSRGDSINGLMIIRDDFGLIRIKSKLIERDDEYSFRYPILLPTKHHVVTCLIREFHLRHFHAGVQILSAKLRENYWILNSRRSIRSVVSQCAKCRRFSSKPVKTAPIHLPLDRVRDATAFEILGVDLAGPLYLKNKTKAWYVLFTCAVFRAIHLELVTSLSTEAFIQALRRFIARRGRPTVIYSDNGTNFVGANNALKALNWKKIVLDQNLHKISWKFIPPTAAWWGGWWERLIRSIKDLLVRILGHSSVYYEEMSTILCDAEATINSRPLTYIHEDFDSLIPLSPSMFLHDSKYVGVPDLDKLDSKKFQDRYRHCQRLREALRSRFRSEYLGQLVQKANERTPKLSVGDVVIVKVEDKRRLHWPMARIVELFPGRDGHSRVAKVRTKLGTLIRPVQKLYPLEVSSGDPILRSKGDTTIEEAHSEAKRTRFKPNGRGFKWAWFQMGVVSVCPTTPTSTTPATCPCDRCTLPDPSDCSAYFHCEGGGTPIRHRCPRGTRYDHELHTCREGAECPAQGLTCPSPQGLFPLPGDCSRSLNCTNGHVVAVRTCPDGLYFNPDRRTCDWTWLAGCGEGIPPPPEPSQSDPSVHCPCKHCLIPDPERCDRYFYCLESRAHPLHCGHDLFFNSSLQTCDYMGRTRCPSSAFSCPSLAGLFPDPNDCSSFYACSNWLPQHQHCPDGLHYNPKSLQCDTICEAACDPSRNCSEFSTTPAPVVPKVCSCSDCTLPDLVDCSSFYQCKDWVPEKKRCPPGSLFDQGQGSCKPQSQVQCPAIADPALCQQPSGLFPVPSNCRQFVHCASGVAFLKTCPANLEFDSHWRVCNWPSGKCDSNPADPACLNSSGHFPNPEDCSSFYHCDHGRAFPKSCPSPLRFNARLGVCDWSWNVDCNHTHPDVPGEEVGECTEDGYATRCGRCPTCLVPDYDSCDVFYRCQANGTVCRHTCPPGLLYNKAVMLCDLPAHVDCQDRPPVTTEAPPRHFTCPAPEGTFSNPDDCSQFYQCYDDQAFLRACPEDLVFNPNLLACDWPDNVPSCRNRVQPTQPPGEFTCPQSRGLFPNAVNCSTFYHCDHGLAHLKSCPASLVFNQALENCDWPENVRNCSGGTDTPPDGDCEEVPDAECPPCTCRVKDTLSCSHFVECQTGRGCRKKCPMGLDFNPESMVCDLPSNVGCRARDQSMHPDHNTGQLRWWCLVHGTDQISPCTLITIPAN
ncbi:hypothetical protein LAZ67_7003416 [Cordylochernes scorpioides]|uniref:Uncharacterized protein n=1 Tax=Cordylochernes scorpioides TaxID=51811 RepID=A0ABY6KNR9_9ARAC|nr:hypothetical protein LAZ67_7003416 [Cordylochernes scorpioides]